MFKYLLALVGIVLIGSLLIGVIHLFKVAQKNKKELSEYENKEIAYENNLGKVLVVYYSLSGNTKDIAYKIADKTKADIFEVKTKDELKQGPSFYLAIKQQLKSKKYPLLEENIPDFSKYDTVFVGFPVWWYTIATPMLSFLEKADFSDKKVIPFSTQGSNFGTSFADFRNMAKNAKIGEGASFNNVDKKYDKAVDNKISSWLNSL